MPKANSTAAHNNVSRFEALVRLVGGRGTVAERNRALRILRSRYGDRLSSSTLDEIERLSAVSTASARQARVQRIIETGTRELGGSSSTQSFSNTREAQKTRTQAKQREKEKEEEDKRDEYYSGHTTVPGYKRKNPYSDKPDVFHQAPSNPPRPLSTWDLLRQNKIKMLNETMRILAQNPKFVQMAARTTYKPRQGIAKGAGFFKKLGKVIKGVAYVGGHIVKAVTPVAGLIANAAVPGSGAAVQAVGEAIGHGLAITERVAGSVETASAATENLAKAEGNPVTNVKAITDSVNGITSSVQDVKDLTKEAKDAINGVKNIKTGLEKGAASDAGVAATPDAVERQAYQRQANLLKKTIIYPSGSQDAANVNGLSSGIANLQGTEAFSQLLNALTPLIMKQIEPVINNRGNVSLEQFQHLLDAYKQTGNGLVAIQQKQGALESLIGGISNKLTSSDAQRVTEERKILLDIASLKEKAAANEKALLMNQQAIEANRQKQAQIEEERKRKDSETTADFSLRLGKINKLQDEQAQQMRELQAQREQHELLLKNHNAELNLLADDFRKQQAWKTAAIKQLEVLPGVSAESAKTARSLSDVLIQQSLLQKSLGEAQQKVDQALSLARNADQQGGASVAQAENEQRLNQLKHQVSALQETVDGLKPFLQARQEQAANIHKASQSYSKQAAKDIQAGQSVLSTEGARTFGNAEDQAEERRRTQEQVNNMFKNKDQEKELQVMTNTYKEGKDAGISNEEMKQNHAAFFKKLWQTADYVEQSSDSPSAQLNAEIAKHIVQEVGGAPVELPKQGQTTVHYNEAPMETDPVDEEIAVTIAQLFKQEDYNNQVVGNNPIKVEQQSAASVSSGSQRPPPPNNFTISYEYMNKQPDKRFTKRRKVSEGGVYIVGGRPDPALDFVHFWDTKYKTFRTGEYYPRKYM